jgi:hypothetical protein
MPKGHQPREHQPSELPEERRSIEMSRRKSFEERARVEVEHIKAQEAAEEEHKQERMREAASAP